MNTHIISFFLPPSPPPPHFFYSECLPFILIFFHIRALAASAPIWQFSGLAHCQSFYDTASDVFNDTSQACHDNLRLGWYTLSAIGEGAGQSSATPPHPNLTPTLILHPSAFPRPQWCPELLHSVDSGFCTSTATLPFNDNGFFLDTSLSLVENLGHLTWVRCSSHKSGATHSYQCVQYFHVSRQWHGSQCLGFLTCTQMLMYAITHRGCTHCIRGYMLFIISANLNIK